VGVAGNSAEGDLVVERSYLRVGKPLLIDSHVHVWRMDPNFPYAEGANVPSVGVDASAETLINLMTPTVSARTVPIQVIHYKWDNKKV
jgi:L-fuconolactonase